MYYLPTKKEEEICRRVIYKILNNDVDEITCKKIMDDIFETTYAIGGDYSMSTLEAVAKTILKINNSN